MIKKKYSHHTMHDEKIQRLYLAAKAVAVPQVISEQLCSGSVGAAVCTKQGRKRFPQFDGEDFIFG